MSFGSVFGEVQASTVSVILIRPHTKSAPIHPERLKDFPLLELTETHARNALDDLTGEQSPHTLIAEIGPGTIRVAAS